MARNEPDPSDWEGQPPVSSGGNGEIEWSIVGYIPIGSDYSGYHNFDPESSERDRQRFDVEPFPDSWEFLNHADVVYAKLTDANGHDQYVIIAGPFDTWDDLAWAVDDMWEAEY